MNTLKKKNLPKYIVNDILKACVMCSKQKLQGVSLEQNEEHCFSADIKYVEKVAENKFFDLKITMLRLSCPKTTGLF